MLQLMLIHQQLRPREPLAAYATKQIVGKFLTGAQAARVLRELVGRQGFGAGRVNVVFWQDWGGVLICCLPFLVI